MVMTLIRSAEDDVMARLQRAWDERVEAYSDWHTKETLWQGGSGGADPPWHQDDANRGRGVDGRREDDRLRRLARGESLDDIEQWIGDQRRAVELAPYSRPILTTTSGETVASQYLLQAAPTLSSRLHSSLGQGR